MLASRPIFLDNTVLSNLALVGRSDVVFHLWEKQVRTTREVQREYQVAAQTGLLPIQAWRDLPVVELTRQERALAETFSKRLGGGERSCLAAAHTQGGVVVTDDVDARAVAQQMNISVTGTLGVLALAVRREVLSLSQANALLTDMIAAGYRSPLAEVDTLL